MSNQPNETDPRMPTMPLIKLSGRPRASALAAGLVYALALYASFETGAASTPFQTFIGIVAFCYAATRPGASARSIALCFSLATVPAFALLQTWLIHITAPGYVGVLFVMSGFLFVAMWLSVRVARRTRSMFAACVCAGLLLAAAEFFRGRLFLSGYPWYTLSQPLLDIPGVPTLASLIGMHGVHTLVCVVGGSMSWLLLSGSASKTGRSAGGWRGITGGQWVLAGLALAAMGVIVAARATRTELRDIGPGEGFAISVVQTNVPQSNKQSSSPEERVRQLRDALDATRFAAEGARMGLGADTALIVWPETMFPGAALNAEAVAALGGSGVPYFQLAEGMRDALVETQASLNIPMLIGAMALSSARIVEDEEPGYVRLRHDGAFNSVFLVNEGRVHEERYDKLHLTPFGEVMPLISRWDWLERQLLAFGAPGMSFDLEAGTNPHRFEVDGVRIATPICFEATMPHVCRRLAFEKGERRADILINATNDGWFGDSVSGRTVHFLLARWRAAELATPVVRAANTGISGFIDERGRVYSRGVRGVLQPSNRPTSVLGFAQSEVTLHARIVPGTRTTLYARTGDVVGWGTLFAGVALAAWGVWPRKNGRPDRDDAGSGANPGPATNA